MYYAIFILEVVEVLMILWDTKYFVSWLTYYWYFELLSILVVDVLLIIWDVMYFGPLYIACATHTRHLRVSILLNTQYFEIRYWLYYMLKVGKQKQQQTMSTHWCPFPFFAITSFQSAFYSLFGHTYLSLNPILSFRFLLIGTMMRVAGRLASRYWLCAFFSLHCRAFSFFLSSFCLYYVRIDGVTLWVMR